MFSGILPRLPTEFSPVTAHNRRGPRSRPKTEQKSVGKTPSVGSPAVLCPLSPASCATAYEYGIGIFHGGPAVRQFRVVRRALCFVLSASSRSHVRYLCCFSSISPCTPSSSSIDCIQGILYALAHHVRYPDRYHRMRSFVVSVSSAI